jgi:hypothetical protein
VSNGGLLASTRAGRFHSSERAYRVGDQEQTDG